MLQALQDASFHLAEHLAGNGLKPMRLQPPAPPAQQQQWRSRDAAARSPVAQGQRPTQPKLPPPYATFPTQQQAFDFADRHPNASALRTYAVESPDRGKRTFLVTTPGRLWHEYAAMPHEERHHYEIIREGRPCHLYFDLEYSPGANPGVIGSELVDLLLHEVDLNLQACFDLQLQHHWVLELDSSTPAKFSRHVIIRLPGLAFADNAHVGMFVRRVVTGALVRAQSCSGLAGLLVAREGDKAGHTLFVDMSVYSRNRAFRLYLSTKAGKHSHLAATARYGGAALTPQQLFFASLITNTDLQPPAAQPPPPQRQQQQHGQLSPSKQHKLSLLRMDGKDAARLSAQPQLPDGHPWRTLLGHGQPGAAGSRSGRAAAWAEGVRSSEARHGPSPFPELQRFVEAVCVEGGVQGRVRTWMVSADASLVLFNMRDNRWCGNVGRAHQSNGIYIVVDLELGVRFQKCYDIDCRGYRSEYMPLPADIWDACRAHVQKLGKPKPVAAATAMAATSQHTLGSADECACHASDSAVALTQEHGGRTGVDSCAFDHACLALLAEFDP